MKRDVRHVDMSKFISKRSEKLQYPTCDRLAYSLCHRDMSVLDFVDPMQCASKECEWRVRNVEARFSFQSEVRYSKHRHAKRVMACELVWQDAMREWQSERVSPRRIFLGLHASPVWRQSAPNHFSFFDMHASLDWRDHPNCCPYLGKIIRNFASIEFPLSTLSLQCCET